MKKIVSIILAICMITVLAAACTTSAPVPESATVESPAPAPTAAPMPQSPPAQPESATEAISEPPTPPPRRPVPEAAPVIVRPLVMDDEYVVAARELMYSKYVDVELGNEEGFVVQFSDLEYRATVRHINNNFSDYYGKTVRIEGVFIEDGVDTVFRMILRQDFSC